MAECHSLVTKRDGESKFNVLINASPLNFVSFSATLCWHWLFLRWMVTTGSIQRGFQWVYHTIHVTY